MSVLSFPRINFRGIFRCNPCTANNDDVMPDVVTRDACTLGSNLDGMDDDQIAAYLRESVIMANYGEDASSDKCTTFIRSGWNLYGNHWTNFQNTTVASVVTGPTASGKITDPTVDPLVGTNITLLGSLGDGSSRRGDPVMVDLDPTGLVTTQLWIGGIQISDPGGAIVINFDTRCFQDWLNFNSTVGAYGGDQNFVGIGCMFQFAIPASALPQDLGSIQSPGLKNLLTQALQQGGIVVRFRVYEVEPGLTDAQLAAAYAQGQGAMNYAYGYLVGTVGVWGVNEPATEPAGRKLTAYYPRPTMYWWPPGGGMNPNALPGCPLPWQGPPALIGNVIAQVTTGSLAWVSLDLSSTFPKNGYRNPDGPNTPSAQGWAAVPQMADVGAVGLYLVQNGESPILIGAIDYGVTDYDTYANFGGIVDIVFDASLLSSLDGDWDLAILGMPNPDGSPNPNNGTALVAEQPFRLVTDDRGMYLTPASTAIVGLYCYQRGAATTQDVVVDLIEYMNIIEEDGSEPHCPDGYRPNQSTDQRTTPNRLNFRPTITIPAGQGFSSPFPVTIQAANGGAALLNFQLDPTPMGPSVPAWSTCVYSSVRVYMNDDYSAIADDIPWAVVYEEALRYYSVLFPAMSTYIPLNLPDSILAQAPTIQKRLAMPNTPMFMSTYSMPVTRTMSPGKIQLILDWIAQEQPKKAALKAAKQEEDEKARKQKAAKV